MHTPYSIFPISIIALALYVLSYLMVRIEIIKQSHHRQIWNIILLITFLSTVTLGLILAFKVNYKLKFQISDQLMVWHVDFGIGMAMVAIFHFLWHFNYYSKLLKRSGKKPESIVSPNAESLTETGKNQKVDLIQQLPVFALGMTAIITQIIIFREFLSIFMGNELVIGTIMANWMILTGLGAYLGKTSTRIKNSGKIVFYAIILSGIIPLTTVIFLNYLKNIIFPIGTMISYMQVLSFSFALLLPFCLLSGFLFTYYANFLSREYGFNLISRVYSMEAAGSLCGGLVYSFVMIYLFHSLQALSIILSVNLIIALNYTRRLKFRVHKIFISLAVLVILSGVFVFKLDSTIKGSLFPNQEIVFMKDTPYGNLVVTESAGQKNFFENNVLLFSTDNVIGREETSHFAMLQHPSPKKILLIGGGISGITNEILKYPVEFIDYVEIDPWITRIGKKYTETLDDPRIRIKNIDARLFVRKTKEKYDVIIMDMPPPASARINRYFSIEFFRELKTISTVGAVISLSMPSTENYVSEKAARVQSVIMQTLKKVFANAVIIPGEKNYFIASDRELSLSISRLSEEREISNIYVNKYYLDDENLQQRSKSIMQSLQTTNQVNTDFRPVAYFMETGYWLSHFRFNYWITGGVLILIILFIIVRMNALNLGLFTTGFTSSSIELLIIISFQIIYGNVYNIIAIIITVFMAGLALGSVYCEKIFSKSGISHYRKIQFTIAFISIILPLFILSMNYLNIPASMGYLAFFLMTLSVSVLAGMQFSMASRLLQDKIANISANIYSVDLFGSAIGAFLVSVLLFPLLGLARAFFLLALINVIVGFLTFRQRKRISV